MRNKFADTFYELGKNDHSLCIVVADISPAGSISKFRNEFPDRFINTGVAEQIMIGMVAGMAQRGLRPFAYTIATFALYRPFEMIRDDLCYQDLPVTVVGIGGGVTYSTLGATHHAQEDIAIASSVPNLSIIAPCDPLETEAATRWCATQKIGPIYLRLGKAGEPNLSQDTSDKWEFGKIRRLRSGEDICIVSYGPIMKLAFQVADLFQSKGKNCSVYSIHTPKPLDRSGIISLLREFNHIIVIEECSYIGSVAMNIKALAYEIRTNAKVDIFCLQDKFIHCYGSHEDILRAHGISIENIASQYNFDVESN